MNVLENCVLKSSINTKNWLKKAAVRAVKTIAQTFAAMVGTAGFLGDVDWKMVLSASVLAGILSIATSVAGIPEAAVETGLEKSGSE